MTDLATRVRCLEPQNICIIKPSSLGDVVHALPILPGLRELFPHAQISWVVSSAFRSLIDGHAEIDHVISYQRGGSGISRRGTLATAELCGRLLRGHYDLTIDLQGLLRSGLMTAATRAPLRVGLADAREGARWFYTHRVDASRLALHAVDRIGRVLAALGLRSFVPRFLLPLSEEDRLWAKSALASVPKPRLILNPGARWQTKRWPPRYFAEIARRADREFGAGLVCVGSRADRDLAENLRAELASIPILDLSGQTTLTQLAAVARNSDLFVSNDTGPIHLAAAAGASVLGIYTCTSPRLTGPYGPRVQTIETCVWCAASLRRRCSRMDCLDELTPDRVWPAVRRLLRQTVESTT